MAEPWSESDVRNATILARTLDIETRDRYFFERHTFTMSSDKDNYLRGERQMPVALPWNKFIVKIKSPFRDAGSQKSGGNRMVIRTVNRITGDTPAVTGGVIWNQGVAKGKEGFDTFREHEIYIGVVRKPWSKQTDSFTKLLQGSWGDQIKAELPRAMIDFNNRYESVHSLLNALIWQMSDHITGPASQDGLAHTKRLNPNQIFPKIDAFTPPTFSTTAATWLQNVARAMMSLRDIGAAGVPETFLNRDFLEQCAIQADNLGIMQFETSRGPRWMGLMHPDMAYWLKRDDDLKSIMQNWGTVKADQQDFFRGYGECLDWADIIWIPEWYAGMEATPYLDTDTAAGVNSATVTSANATGVAFGPLKAATIADPADGTKYIPSPKDVTEHLSKRSAAYTAGAGASLGIKAGFICGQHALLGIEQEPVSFAQEDDDYGEKLGVCTKTIHGYARNEDWQPDVDTKTSVRCDTCAQFNVYAPNPGN